MGDKNVISAGVGGGAAVGLTSPSFKPLAEIDLTYNRNHSLGAHDVGADASVQFNLGVKKGYDTVVGMHVRWRQIFDFNKSILLDTGAGVAVADSGGVKPTLWVSPFVWPYQMDLNFGAKLMLVGSEIRALGFINIPFSY